MYNSFAFTRNIVVLIIFNIAYNTKKKQTTKNYIIKIVSINIDRAKIVDIVFNSFCFNIIKFQTSNLTSKILNNSR